MIISVDKDSLFNIFGVSSFNSLEDKINDTNLNNKLLEQKLNDTEKYYSSILRNQELIAENEVNQLKSILEQQEKNHQDTISNLFYLFNMIVATFIFLGAGMTFFGKNYLIKKIKKEISSNHVQVTTKLVSELGEKKEFIEIIKAQENQVLSTLEKPYVLLTVFVEETHVNLLYSEELKNIYKIFLPTIIPTNVLIPDRR